MIELTVPNETLDFTKPLVVKYFLKDSTLHIFKGYACASERYSYDVTSETLSDIENNLVKLDQIDLEKLKKTGTESRLDINCGNDGSLYSLINEYIYDIKDQVYEQNQEFEREMNDFMDKF